MKQKILLIICLVLPFGLLAQSGSISGQILDKETGEALIGASVIIQGTSKGSVTDIEGNFNIKNVEDGEIILLVNFVGYGEQKKTLTVSGNSSLGVVNLESSSIGLSEVMVIASVAVNRKTPVAVSTVSAIQIESKIGSQEFPEILKSTPGVFATKSGGGFGDGRISIRGFDSENVAVLINGVPVNDMENGKVYWSNWAGLTDAASSIQVQRGLGASKVAVPSVGGTINILSRASDREQGGSVSLSTGNNAYSKLGFSVSSGLTEKGWAVTLSGARTQGDNYFEGQQFLGYSYFANIAKKINNNHQLSFTLVGAKQEHGQTFHNSSLEDLEKNPVGNKYNPDWGYKNGQVMHLAQNFYHKPQMSMNHYWTISDKTELSTAVYASFGKGGGRRAQGTINEFSNLKRTGGKYGPVDVDHYVTENEANPSGESLAWISASRNAHNWYGVLSTLDHQLTDNLTLLAGIDLRSYKGLHYYEITDLLGGDYITNSDDVNNPNATLTVGDRYNKDYEGLVLWTGFFGQLEYSKDALSAFVSLSGSNTTYQKTDFISYLDSDPARKSEKLGFLGYQAKGGANYNLNDNHNVFANIGYFTKAPVWDNVFAGGDNSNEVNEGAENEKIFSLELGYGLRIGGLVASVNVYRTEWKDRALQETFTTTNDEILYANILGVNALHQGIEFEGMYTVNDKLTLTGMLSLGDWTWQNDVEDVYIRDPDGNEVGDPINVYIAGLKVGNAAQTTAALGFNYKLIKDFSIGMDFNYYDNLFASYDPTSRSTAEDKVDAWKVPAYGLLDLNIAYQLEIAGLKSSLYGNVNNITNTKYVADASDGSGHDAATSKMYAGMGTTWTIGAKIRF